MCDTRVVPVAGGYVSGFLYMLSHQPEKHNEIFGRTCVSNEVDEDQEEDKLHRSGDGILEMSLPSNNLQGSLPYEMSLLSKAEVIYFWDNPLEGQFPVFLQHMERLQFLNLMDNKISGSIPTEIGNFKALIGL